MDIEEMGKALVIYGDDFRHPDNVKWANRVVGEMARRYYEMVKEGPFDGAALHPSTGRVALNCGSPLPWPKSYRRLYAHPPEEP